MNSDGWLEGIGFIIMFGVGERAGRLIGAMRQSRLRNGFGMEINWLKNGELRIIAPILTLWAILVRVTFPKFERWNNSLK